eukprot:CAMPEP_0202727826 /NCGR_PEP_ID=MMETSP1385-20130828/185317_1 /ASSEMBLY_ACC=CAM_ASM_000861 /TAXON_ID=933848 /ORGANISM="Elphidium margaritaceum" /LENGTH=325 /DNA_ID=CAMNT_0049394069 /DNA_START=1543 /DNA_END=2520 /DNA_ORIENTATION=-
MSQNAKLVYVGNLPADATEDEMRALCSQVGPAVRFRIVYDRESGQPKGYGFCEYRDPKLVDSAINLLHGFEHKGSKLFVRRAAPHAVHSNEEHNAALDIHDVHNGNAQLAAGNPLLKKRKRSKRKSVDEINRVVQGFSTSEKREILCQMKELIESNEEGAKDILLENPQLAQALLLIQMEFNLVKATDIHALTKAVSNQIATPAQTQSQSLSQSVRTESPSPSLRSHNSQQMHSHSSHPPSHTPSSTAAITVSENIPNENENENDSETVMQPSNDEAVKGLSDDQEKVLKRVMSMTDEQIAGLPPNVQKQVLTVKAQLEKKKKLK